MADNIQYHDLPDEDEFCELDDEEEEEPEEDPEPEDPGEPDAPEPGPDVPELPPVVPPPVEPVPLIPPLFIPNPHPWSNKTVPFETAIPATPISTTTTPTTTAAAEPTQTDIVDFSKDKKPRCYNSGYKAKRKALVDAIDSLCLVVGQALTANNRADLGPGLYQNDRNFRVKGQKYTDYVTTFEIKDSCKWPHYGRVDCNTEFRKIVDGCNTRGENGKQGGTMEGNCIKWRVDPNEETA
jgi:hypothetical protein